MNEHQRCGKSQDNGTTKCELVARDLAKLAGSKPEGVRLWCERTLHVRLVAKGETRMRTK
jgi:hypothetical protein